MRHPKKIQESLALTSNTRLSTLLSNEMVLYIKIRKLQWNELGDSFPYLQKLFHSLYIAIEDTIELVADRINLLGGKASSTMKESADLYKNDKPNKHSHKDMMAELLYEQEAISAEFKKEIADNGNYTDSVTKEFLLDVIEQRQTTNLILRNISNIISSEFDKTRDQKP